MLQPAWSLAEASWIGRIGAGSPFLSKDLAFELLGVSPSGVDLW